MKISGSLKRKFEGQEANAKGLKEKLNNPELPSQSSIASWCNSYGWHFIDRIKEIESYAQKLEQSHNDLIDDVYAGTIIVKNKAEIKKCCSLLEGNESSLNIIFQYKRPKDINVAMFSADRFTFDSVRMYFKISDPYLKDPLYKDEVFEIQIKTLLDEAWGKASHDFFYKTNEPLSWAKSRLMSQIKALLENAEIALSEADILSKSELLQKSDGHLDKLNDIMTFYQDRWDNSALPQDMRRMAQNTQDLLEYLNKDLTYLSKVLEAETLLGKGVNVINLSPYWIMVQSIISDMGWEKFLVKMNKTLKQGRYKSKTFPIIKELDLPDNITLKDYPNIRIIG